MKPFYRPLLSQSWEITRTNLTLWPLALLASAIGISGTFQIFLDLLMGSELGFNTGIYTQTDFITSLFVGWNRGFELISWVDISFTDIVPLLLLFLLLVIVFGLAIITISSEGGLIHGASQLLNKKKATYLQSFRQGFDKFWHLFTIHIVYALLYLLIVNLVIVPFILIALASRSPQNLLFAALTYFIIIPLVIILDLVLRYSLMFIILRTDTNRTTFVSSILNAFGDAWTLFRVNWVISIETSLTLLVILLATFGLLSIILLPAVTFLFAFFALMVAPFATAFQIIAFTSFIALVAIVALFLTIFTTFQANMWVAVFNRLTTGTHHSKIHRLVRHLPILHRRII